MSVHKPVLLKESIEALNLKNGDIVVDATLGGGGHAREILKKIGDDGILIGIDADIEAIKNFAEFPISNEKLRGNLVALRNFQRKVAWQPRCFTQFPNNFQIPIFKCKNIFLVNGNFADLENILDSLKIKKVDAVLADLGFSSDQLEDATRGFSFQKDAELDMRMDSNTEMTARKIVNCYFEEDLKRILSEYGEEKFSKNIAKKICIVRKIKEIKTTKELVEIIISAIPERYRLRSRQMIHPATRTFQALRIEVNQELENLKKFLPQAIGALKVKGRIAIISFHSLEDRIVKNMFRENARGCICPPVIPVCRCDHQPVIKIITKKPIVSSEKEINNNPRSRSAKLRIAEKIA